MLRMKTSGHSLDTKMPPSSCGRECSGLPFVPDGAIYALLWTGTQLRRINAELVDSLTISSVSRYICWIGIVSLLINLLSKSQLSRPS